MALAGPETEVWTSSSSLSTTRRKISMTKLRFERGWFACSREVIAGVGTTGSPNWRLRSHGPRMESRGRSVTYSLPPGGKAHRSNQARRFPSTLPTLPTTRSCRHRCWISATRNTWQSGWRRYRGRPHSGQDFAPNLHRVQSEGHTRSTLVFSIDREAGQSPATWRDPVFMSDLPKSTNFDIAAIWPDIPEFTRKDCSIT
jgi:hypothetical protein